MHVLAILPAWFWHPLGQCVGTHAEYIRCRSYNWWSGIASDFGEVTLIGTILGTAAMGYRHIECHQEGCHRLGKYSHGHMRLCGVHHPLVPNNGKINQTHIDAETKRKEGE